MNKALVIKSTGSNYELLLPNEQVIQAKTKGKLRMLDLKSTNPLAVGDTVSVQLEENNYLITAIDKRKNYIVRKSVNLSKQTQIIASNLDQLVLICCLSNPKTQTGFIDRYLVTAESQHIPIIIVFNKIDSYTSDALDELSYLKQIYNDLNYQIITTSIFDKQSVDDLKKLTANKTSLFAGNSGVGKSSLLNTLDIKMNARTGEVSSHNIKGKHTTTFAELFSTDYNAKIIDTPGVKSFGIVNFSRDEIAGYFADFRKYASECKFNNCSHIEEPKCAVKQAVENQSIAKFRYQNYLNIYDSEEMEEKY